MNDDQNLEAESNQADVKNKQNFHLLKTV